MKKAVILLLLVISPSLHYAQLSVQEAHFNIVSVTSPPPGATLYVSTVLFGLYGIIEHPLFDASFLTPQQESSRPGLFSPPMFYPTPFRLSEGSILYYQMDRDAPIDVIVYDNRFNELARQSFFSGQDPGGKAGANSVPVDRYFLGYASMPAGIYFYVLISDGVIIGKGKFALLP